MRKGFTLIPMLVVLVVISTTTLMVVYYAGRSNEEIEKLANDVVKPITVTNRNISTANTNVVVTNTNNSNIETANEILKVTSPKNGGLYTEGQNIRIIGTTEPGYYIQAYGNYSAADLECLTGNSFSNGGSGRADTNGEFDFVINYLGYKARENTLVVAALPQVSGSDCFPEENVSEVITYTYSPIADWKAYTNGTYLFSFKYPPDGFQQGDEQADYIRFQNYAFPTDPESESMGLKTDEYYIESVILTKEKQTVTCSDYVVNGTAKTFGTREGILGDGVVEGGDPGGVLSTACVSDDDYSVILTITEPESARTYSQRVINSLNFTQ